MKKLLSLITFSFFPVLLSVLIGTLILSGISKLVNIGYFLFILSSIVYLVLGLIFVIACLDEKTIDKVWAGVEKSSIGVEKGIFLTIWFHRLMLPLFIGTALLIASFGGWSLILAFFGLSPIFATYSMKKAYIALKNRKEAKEKESSADKKDKAVADVLEIFKRGRI